MKRAVIGTKRAVIFLHGNKPSKELIQKHIKKSDFVIAADGGAEYAVDAGITPDVIIGDLDSIPHHIEKTLRNTHVEWIIYPPDKNETDSELALLYAQDHHYTDIIIFGASGNRVDHFLANVLLIATHTHNFSVTLIEETQRIYIIDSSLTLKGKKGDFVSLIPLIHDVTGITLEGFAYPLSNETLYFGKTRGVSNELMKRSASIKVSSGTLMVVHTI